MASRTYLADILDAHRSRAQADHRALSALESEATRSPSPRRFVDALADADGLAVIAEIKRRSPSRGDLDPTLDPAALAAEYAAAGASCLSVLTDADFFGGSPDDLARARAACPLPLLRKDFTVSEADVYDARIMGADAVLLIVAALDQGELERLHALAASLDLAALVEVHDGVELERALGIGASLVGVNQRDLRTFAVDHNRAVELAAHVPHGVLSVAESGVRDGADAARLAEAGYRAVLVGETLLTSTDRAAALSGLRGHPVGEASRRPTPATPTRG